MAGILCVVVAVVVIVTVVVVVCLSFLSDGKSYVLPVNVLARPADADANVRRC